MGEFKQISTTFGSSTSKDGLSHRISEKQDSYPVEYFQRQISSMKSTFCVENCYISMEKYTEC